MEIIGIILITILLLGSIVITYYKPHIAQLFLLPIFLLRTIPVQSALPFPYISESLIGGFILGSAIFAFKNRKTITVPCKAILIAIILMGAYSMIVAGMTSSTLTFYLSHIVLPIALCVALIIRPAKQHTMIQKSILITLAIISLYAFAQWVIPQLQISPWNGIQEQFRATSFFSHPNYYAMFAAPLIAFLGVSLSTNKEYNRRPRVLLFIVAFFALMLTQSFGGILSVIIALGIFYFAKAKTPQRIQITGAAVLCVIFALTILPIRTMFQENILPTGNSNTIRKEIWLGTYELLKAHPLKGVGLGNFEESFAEIQPLSHTVRHPYPHNLYLALWIETTVFGLILFIVIIIKAFHVAIHNTKHPHHLPLIAALATLCIHGIVDTPYFHPALSFLFWWQVAMLLQYQQQKKHNQVMLSKQDTAQPTEN